MESLKKVNDAKLDYIESLSETGLEQLLNTLIKKYYQAYLDNDVDKLQSTLSFIEDIELIVEDKGFDFGNYINYCLLCNAIFIIKTIFKQNVELKPYYDATIKKQSALDGLTNAFHSNKRSFVNGADKVRIKDLHEMCKHDPTINEDIMQLVDAIYDSFANLDESNGGDVNA